MIIVTVYQNPSFEGLTILFFIYKSNSIKGKPPEKTGRKVTGLSSLPEDMAAEPPGNIPVTVVLP
jgi:hypothetical protein